MREKVSSLKVSGPVLALLVLILGGIYFGFFTPTEAGAVGAFGAIVITYVSGYMERKKFLASLLEAGSITAMILLLMIGAFIFMRFVTVSKLAFSIPEFIGRLGLSPYLVLSLIVVFYILFGMFFEIMSGMTLTLPLIYPIIVHLGFDPIWFGVVLVLLMEMGLATPPIGLNVFLLSTVTDVPMKTIFRGVWPFVGAIFVAIVIVVAFPELALFLPAKMLR
jgi:tripartite ATP-independent transporter DctM subunit